MPNKNRKTSPELQRIANPGPAEDARSYTVKNPSGIENQNFPRGRGQTAIEESPKHRPSRSGP
jgi:hypothetical protein